MPEELFEVKFTGGGISLPNVKIPEVVAILEGLEDIIRTIARTQSPTSKVNDVQINLSGLKRSSILISLVLGGPAIAAYLYYAENISKKNLAPFTGRVVERTEQILNFGKQHHCRAIFKRAGAKSPLLAEITPKTDFTHFGEISGETTVAGIVTRVGGSTPTVRIKTFSGERIDCRASKKIAEALGGLLYRRVSCSGKAVWWGNDAELKEFRIQTFNELEDKPLPEVFAELREKFGHFFEGVDPEKFTAEIRGDD